MSKPILPTYKATNWPGYNKALKQRGSLTIWFDAEMAWAANQTDSSYKSAAHVVRLRAEHMLNPDAHR